MIAYITYSKKSKQLYLDKSIVFIEILGERLRFIRDKESYFIKVNFESEITTKGPFVHGDIATVKTENIKINIYFSQYSKNYLLFQKYQIQNEITISNMIDSDIYIQDFNFQNSKILYSPFSHILSIENNQIEISVNNAVIKNEICIKNGDRLQFLNLIIIFHSQFLMINQIENIYISLKNYQVANIFKKLIRPLALNLKPEHRKYHNLNMVPINLIAPEIMEQSLSHQPLLLTIGPMMTISFATLSVGIFHAFQGYLQGKEIIELLPNILFPLVLLFSILFWIPIKHIYENIRYKRKLQNRTQTYLQYLEHTFHEYAIQLHEINIYLRKQFISYSDFVNHTYNNDNLWTKKRNDFDWLWIYFGEERTEITVQYLQLFQLSNNDPLYKSIEEFKNKKIIENKNCIYLNFLDYSNIYIQPHKDSINLFLYFLLQIFFYYPEDEIKISIYCDENFVDQYPWLYHIGHLKLQQKRNIFLQNSSLPIRFLIHDNSKINCLIAMPNHRLSKDEIMISFPDNYIKVELENKIYSIQNDLSKDLPFEIIINKIKNRNWQQDIKSISQPFSFFDLNHIEKANELNIYSAWKKNKCINGIIAIIGIDKNEQALSINLHENADGPHGLLAGTTGSGKSELMITLLLSLSTRYSPRELQFLLIDFKGGGITTIFNNQNFQLPHITATLTNLDEHCMEKALYSLSLECKRREEFFQQASNISKTTISNIDSFQKYHHMYLELEYLPHILIIVDEFAELKRLQPIFLNELVSIARIGRSLGIHLLLSTQKPTGVIDEQIWSNSHYKICLKVQTKQDSYDVLHTNIAAKLSAAGEFYLFSHNQIKYAQAAYSASQLKQYDKEIILYKPNLSIQEKTNESIIPVLEINAILKEIEEIKLQFSNYKLWLDIPLLQYKKEYGLQVGYLDNYYNHSFDLYHLFGKERTVLYIGSQIDSKIFILQLWMYILFQTIQREDEIYIFYKSLEMVEKWIDCGQVIEICQYNDEEKLDNIMKHIQQRTSRNCIYCIFLDYENRNNDFSNYNNQIKQLVDNLDLWNVFIIFHIQSIHQVNYHFLLQFKRKIALCNDDLQSLSSIFEIRIKNIISEISKAYVKENGKLFLLHFFQINEENINFYIQQQKSFQKLVHIYKMPKEIFYDPKHTNGIGICFDNYEWLIKKADKALLVIATYRNEILPFFQFWNYYYQNIVWMKEENFSKYVIRNFVICMTLQEYQKCKKSIDIPILYIGCGFHEQYIFQKKLKKPLLENQGIYFYEMEKRVIQLVQQE